MAVPVVTVSPRPRLGSRVEAVAPAAMPERSAWVVGAVTVVTVRRLWRRSVLAVPVVMVVPVGAAV
jgi:hypothetical protein